MTTLLYLEDDEDDRYLFDKAINEIAVDCTVFYASSGFDVMYLLNKERPQMIFLDIQLDNESGITFLKKIRTMEQWNAVPIIIFSNQNSEKLKAECLFEKADLFVEKPRKYSDLMDTLRDLIVRDWPVTFEPVNVLR